MRTIDVIRALGPADARYVTRDSMMRWLLVLSPAFALFYRFGVPAIDRWLDTQFGFDLAPYFPLVMSTVGVMAAGIIGAVIGFLLLDQRDEQTLTAMLVTPVTLGDYLRYRLAIPTILCTILTACIFPIAGLTRLTAAQVIVCAVTAAPLAALYTLFIGSFANNKVQGLAVSKAAGILAPPAIAAYFLPMPWQLFAGVVPHYWPLKVFWEFDLGHRSAWAYAMIGLIYQVMLLRLLARHFARVSRRG